MIYGQKQENQWPFGMPGAGSYDSLDSISPSSLSFTQGPLTTPRIDTSTLVQTPSFGGMSNLGGLSSLSGMDKAGLALGGLQAIGNMIMSFKAANLAKKQFRFQRDFANANLSNSIKTFNTALEDRIRSRSATEGREPGYADSYLEKNKLEYKRVG